MTGARLLPLVVSLSLSLLATFASGCSAYLRQATAGQIALKRAERPVADVLADPGTTPVLRQRLVTAAAALEFARRELSLPDNGSYRRVVELGRPYVVWNVFAAPEFSLELRRWCFPVAGCVAYRGYFAEADARRYADELRGEGADVAVAGAAAYSTLGFFRDPLLSSMLALSDRGVAALLFHELAHQRVYARGDTAFNEGLATLVEHEGMLAWLESRGDQAGLCRYVQSLAREREVQDLIAVARRRLRRLYRSGPGGDAGRAAKAAEFARLRAEYETLRGRWVGPPYFDAWFRGPLDNAVLGAAGAYSSKVDVLRVIFESERRDWPAFFKRMQRLARLDNAERARVLAAIVRPEPRRSPPGCTPG
jgi:predicted aminopeptidase